MEINIRIRTGNNRNRPQRKEESNVVARFFRKHWFGATAVFLTGTGVLFADRYLVGSMPDIQSRPPDYSVSPLEPGELPGFPVAMTEISEGKDFRVGNFTVGLVNLHTLNGKTVASVQIAHNGTQYESVELVLGEAVRIKFSDGEGFLVYFGSANEAKNGTHCTGKFAIFELKEFPQDEFDVGATESKPTRI